MMSSDGTDRRGPPGCGTGMVAGVARAVAGDVPRSVRTRRPRARVEEGASITTRGAGPGRGLLAAASCLGLIAGLAAGARAEGRPPASRQPAAGPARPATAFRGGFAVVDPTGRLVRGRNVTAASLLEPGFYRVDFPGNVTRCGFLATLTSPSSGRPLIGTIGTATTVASPRAVVVEIHGGGDVTPANASFALQVVC